MPVSDKFAELTEKAEKAQGNSMIPAPTLVQKAHGYYDFPPNVRIAGSVDAVAAPAADAAARINALTAHQVTVVPDATDAEVSLYLADVDADFTEVPEPQGINPSDTDPRDERYVISIDATGVQIRAAAAEGLTRGLEELTAECRARIAAADAAPQELQPAQ